MGERLALGLFAVIEGDPWVMGLVVLAIAILSIAFVLKRLRGARRRAREEK